mmetsp:Transcript_21112/g.27387  ORF Transcript_21112/g.27387 Transcript_21112/m.27387 type:complete len:951 (+) Transcript_21112:86-2938(+)
MSQFNAASSVNSLALKWSFGFNKNIIEGVHSLCSEERRALFYVSAHSGVIYDYNLRRQSLLQGHCNPITCCAVSADKKWVVTADGGPTDSMVVIWDATSASPVKSIFNPHPKGVRALDMSPDAMFVVTLSETRTAEGQQFMESDLSPQQIALWEWTVEREDPLYVAEVDNLNDVQTCVKFNPSNIRQIVTNGEKKTIFWSWMEGSLQGYLPKVSKRDFLQGIGRLQCSCFLPDTMQAITGNSEGDVVVWDGSLAKPEDGEEMLANIRAIKMIRLSEAPIYHLSTTEKYLCVAGEDGSVRFYDFQFRLEAWFEDLNAGPVTSVSFSSAGPESTGAILSFSVPDFVVGTKQAYIVGVTAEIFEEVDPDKRRGVVLVQGVSDEVSGLATHPLAPHILICCYSGDAQLWDYHRHQLLMVRNFDSTKFRPQCASFHPRGTCIVMGYTSGVVKILDPATLEDFCIFRCSSAVILGIRFSPSGKQFAAFDADHHVLLWKYVLDDNAEVKPETDDDFLDSKLSSAARLMRQGWEYIGRYRSHTKPITGLEFGAREDGRVSLISVAEDRTLVEYDLNGSTLEEGMKLAEQPAKIEQVARPTCCAWHPLLGGDYEDRIITANNEFKIRQWNGDDKMCRRTSLGPTFGGPLNSLMQIPLSTGETEEVEGGEVVITKPSGYMAYTTHEKVIGVVSLPFDGNPHSAMGLIAHPGQISSSAVSGDGEFFFSAGGKDLSVNMWKINLHALGTVADASRAAGAESFIEQLEGGKDGEMYNELVDYFYYSQLRTQGEDTVEERKAEGRVLLSEIPNLMRALGHYPSELEVTQMVSEIKYCNFTTTGEVMKDLDLDQFIRLFINHRPVLPVGKAMIDNAFKSLNADAFSGQLSWNHLMNALQNAGEKMSIEDLNSCLKSLVGDEDISEKFQMLAASEFAEEILGFEDYEDNMQQQDEEYSQDQGFSIA